LSAVEGSDTILVSGATGLVGGRWLQRLSSDVSVRMLTRRAREPRPGSPEPVVWNGRDLPEGALAGASTVVHLSGEPIFGGIPTAARRRRMVDSRVASTASIVDAMGRLPAGDRPDVLVCASAVGIYGDRGEEELTESAAPGSGFLARLCEDWEAAARAAESHGVRVVSLRIGLVLAREGGALAGLRHLFRLGLGGPIAQGRQWMPWIHVDDLARLLEAVRNDPGATGPVNAVAPRPVRNADFTRALAERLRRPALLRAPAFALRASLGPLASELLDSRRVIPARAQALGFAWRHADIASALAEELS
jgi:uncharacterized protein (TIGR01777 family)